MRARGAAGGSRAPVSDGSEATGAAARRPVGRVRGWMRRAHRAMAGEGGRRRRAGAAGSEARRLRDAGPPAAGAASAVPCRRASRTHGRAIPTRDGGGRRPCTGLGGLSDARGAPDENLCPCDRGRRDLQRLSRPRRLRSGELRAVEGKRRVRGRGARFRRRRPHGRGPDAPDRADRGRGQVQRDRPDVVQPALRGRRGELRRQRAGRGRAGRYRPAPGGRGGRPPRLLRTNHGVWRSFLGISTTARATPTCRCRAGAGRCPFRTAAR